MVKGGRVLVIALACVFLFTGLTYAAQKVIVKYPVGGELFVSGQTERIHVKVKPLQFPVNDPVVKYDIFLSLDAGVNWKMIGTRNCAAQSHCYPYFYWSVLTVGETKSQCLIKAVAKNKAGAVVGKDTSDAYFTIQPAVTQLPECADGIDNDSDGDTDYPDDSECTNEVDDDESS